MWLHLIDAGTILKVTFYESKKCQATCWSSQIADPGFEQNLSTGEISDRKSRKNFFP